MCVLLQEQLTPRTEFCNASSDQEQKLEGTSFTARTSLSLDTALSLYNMTDSQSFWEIQQDTRCLIGWGCSTVVVAFRGTASMKNALADLQVLVSPCGFNGVWGEGRARLMDAGVTAHCFPSTWFNGSLGWGLGGGGAGCVGGCRGQLHSAASFAHFPQESLTHLYSDAFGQ